MPEIEELVIDDGSEADSEPEPVGGEEDLESEPEEQPAEDSDEEPPIPRRPGQGHQVHPRPAEGGGPGELGRGDPPRPARGAAQEEEGHGPRRRAGGHAARTVASHE